MGWGDAKLVAICGAALGAPLALLALSFACATAVVVHPRREGARADCLRALHRRRDGARASVRAGALSLVRIVITLWGGLFLALGFIKLPGDGDLYWQRWLGEALLQTHQLPVSLGHETFTAQGATWIPQEWLLSLALALAAHSGLSAALLFLVSLVPCGILLSIYFRARGTANPVAIGVVLVFAGIAMLESFGLRAQVLGWAAFAAFLFFLEREDRWQWATIPTVILWANLHASVMIAPAIVVARAIGRVGDGGWKALRNGRELAILAGTALGTLCTPLGWKLPFFAIAFSHSPIRNFIEEWRRPGAADLSFVAGALPLAIAVVLGGRATLWDDKRRSFPALLTFLMMIFAGRNIPLFAIAAAPLAAIGLDLRFPRISRHRPKDARDGAGRHGCDLLCHHLLRRSDGDCAAPHAAGTADRRDGIAG